MIDRGRSCQRGRALGRQFGVSMTTADRPGSAWRPALVVDGAASRRPGCDKSSASGSALFTAAVGRQCSSGASIPCKRTVIKPLSSIARLVVCPCTVACEINFALNFESPFGHSLLPFTRQLLEASRPAVPGEAVIVLVVAGWRIRGNEGHFVAVHVKPSTRRVAHAEVQITGAIRSMYHELSAVFCVRIAA